MQLLIPPWDFGSSRFEAVLADSQELQDICFKLRYTAFCDPVHPGDRVRFAPENYPDKRELDRYDSHSYHILALHKRDGLSEPVGTFRLIRCEQGYFMEKEEFSGVPFELPEYHAGERVIPSKTLEAGRWCGHPVLVEEAGQRVLVSMLLASAALKLSERLGRTHWVCGVDHHSAARLRKLGWPMDQVIPGVHNYYDDLSEVCIIPLGNYDMPCARYVPVSSDRMVRQGFSK